MIKLNGIKLPHLKGTALCETISAPVPKKIVVPMSMSMGKSADICVDIGDEVFVGQKIGEGSGAFALPIHSSVSGKVCAIGQIRMINGTICKTVEIESDGNQTLAEGINPPQIESKSDFINAMKESGICGLGGAGFPLYVKLSTKIEIDTLIINAAECEPYITSDCREILENCDDIIAGIRLVLKHLDIKNAIIAIESNKPEAIELLQQKTQNCDDIKLHVLSQRYPQGAEKVIIHSVTKKVVKQNMLPADVGVVVINVSTASAIKRYCDTGIPLIKRRVTVEGDCVKNPCNIDAFIGTPAHTILEMAQTDFSKAKRIVFGGPMMGNCKISSLSPITKTTSAILALSREPYKAQTACIRCAKCVSACPLNLMPTEIEKAYKARDVEALKALNVNLCMNCASCSYVCPANRNIAQINQLAKELIPRE